MGTNLTPLVADLLILVAASCYLFLTIIKQISRKRSTLLRGISITYSTYMILTIYILNTMVFQLHKANSKILNSFVFGLD